MLFNFSSIWAPKINCRYRNESYREIRANHPGYAAVRWTQLHKHFQTIFKPIVCPRKRTVSTGNSMCPSNHYSPQVYSVTLRWFILKPTKFHLRFIQSIYLQNLAFHAAKDIPVNNFRDFVSSESL